MPRKDKEQNMNNELPLTPKQAQKLLKKLDAQWAAVDTRIEAQQRQRQVATMDLTGSRGVPVTFIGDAGASFNRAAANAVRPVSTRRTY